ncbi:MAG: asparagine synthase (glutamine-hydrolyzing) [Thermoanaerobaculia bacterium]
MCGIASLFVYGETSDCVDSDELIRIREAMSPRGPDGSGLWISPDRRTGLAHRRLKIIDLSEAAAQPMAAGPLTIVFNGEIFNYRELRGELEREGVTFRSHSDTEVLLRLYERYGADALRRLRGMFAFVVWDERTRSLFAARDPFGIKPLYYFDDGSTIRIASQVKALRAGGAVGSSVEPAGVAGFLLMGVVPEPFTMYRDVRALPAGSFLRVSADGVRETPYYVLAEKFRNAVLDATDLDDESSGRILNETIRESVAAHLVSDVPVGVFLSGGLDSSSVTGVIRDLTDGEIPTLTVGFSEYAGRQTDETPYAREAAELYRTSHSTRIVTREEFEASLPEIFSAMDQPSIDGVNSWFVSLAARELGWKTAISGTGGDELFGGYHSFRKIPRRVRLLSLPARIPGAGDLLWRLVEPIARRSSKVNPRIGAMLKYGGSYGGAYLIKRGLFMPEELGSIMGDEAAAEGLARLGTIDFISRELDPDPGTPSTRVAVLEMRLFLRNRLLRDIDWASMAHGLEVRVPLIDVPLFERLLPIIVKHPGWAKHLLTGVPTRGVPQSLLTRRKTGFNVPIRQWAREAKERRPEFGNRSWARRIYEEQILGASNPSFDPVRELIEA